MGRFTICFLLVLQFVVIQVHAQQKIGFIGNINTTDSVIRTVQKTFTVSSGNFNAFNSQMLLSPQAMMPTAISSNYYTDHLGMMCKEELKLEKITKLPLRIRLGSKDQVDYLEGKNYHH